jgi:hypothetical protein
MNCFQSRESLDVLSSKRLLLALVLTGFLALSMVPQIPQASAATLFEDGFEAGNYGAWTGTQSSVDVDLGISTWGPDAHHGIHHAYAYTPGYGGLESAYCYKSVAA